MADGNYSLALEKSPIENIQSQVVIESLDNQFVLNQLSRWDLIKNQLSNRYSPSNLPPVVHIEAKPDVGNLGNLHPMKLGRLLAEKVSCI